jgi:hypothetical protein
MHPMILLSMMTPNPVPFNATLSFVFRQKFMHRKKQVGDKFGIKFRLPFKMLWAEKIQFPTH